MVEKKRRRRRTSDKYWDTELKGVTISNNRESQLDEIKRADESRQRSLNDGGTTINGQEILMKHPIGVGTIDRLFKQSNMLRQCVDSYITNITGFGARVVPTDPDVEMNEEELATLESWIRQFNTDRSFAQENRAQIFDYEKYGGRYLEIIRDASGRPSLARHLPYANMHIQSKQKKRLKVSRAIERGGRRVEVQERKRFRRFVQRIGGSTVFFKEFGDPRKMDYRDGRYETAAKRVQKQYEATEVLFRKQESEDVYGEPRWIAMAPVILGSRESEEVNLRYFEDNTVPAAFLTISGGRVTRESFQEIRQLIEESGMNKQNSITLIEAISETGGIDDKAGSVDIKVEKMTDQRQSDGLFKEYDEANQVKIRSAFRLPPVLLGLSQDVTFATANVSAFIAEMQVFQPERASHDDWLNNQFINHDFGLGLKTVKLESRGPSITTPQDVVKAMTAANVMGALTPRSAIDMINDQMMVSMPQYPEEGQDGWMPWMDQPLALSLRLAGTSDEQDNDIDKTDVESEISDSESEEREIEEEGNITDLESRRRM